MLFTWQGSAKLTTLTFLPSGAIAAGKVTNMHKVTSRVCLQSCFRCKITSWMYCIHCQYCALKLEFFGHVGAFKDFGKPNTHLSQLAASHQTSHTALQNNPVSQSSLTWIYPSIRFWYLLIHVWLAGVSWGPGPAVRRREARPPWIGHQLGRHTKTDNLHTGSHLRSI